MKYDAVIFDLFGTLIDKFSIKQSYETLRQMADVLSINSDDFIQYWYATFNERGTGVFQSFEANIEYICDKLNIPVKESQVIEAAQIDRAYTVRFMKPRSYAIEVLTHLKSHGYKTGLITNCSAEIPYIWNNMPFAQLTDVAVFSCSVGFLKPDPRIYRLAIEQLAVQPNKCLYIGDGDSQELSGADVVGMHPVLIRDPDEDRSDVHRVDYEADDWDGPTIASLSEILSLL
jgi:putative hydrolase of the HAD superfamily